MGEALQVKGCEGWLPAFVIQQRGQADVACGLSDRSHQDVQEFSVAVGQACLPSKTQALPHICACKHLRGSVAQAALSRPSQM
jgi:hypothetical protein